MPFGAHVSIAGGVHKAVLRGQQIGCQTIQVFTKGNLRWAASPLGNETLEKWYRNLKETGIAPVVAHDSYLIGLARREAMAEVPGCLCPRNRAL
jgi:deoxyribonuclease-4